LSTASTPADVSLADVELAAAQIGDAVVHTPAVRSGPFSALADADVWLKLEIFQTTGSFKERGALSKLLSLNESERARGVIAMSAGNHAQGLAYHGTRLGLQTTIVMPEMTPFTKVRRTRRFGARVILTGRDIAEATAATYRLIDEHGYTLIHPYDDPHVIAGQGTAALEFIRAVPPLDVLLVPVGGGGLIAGAALVAKALSPRTEVIGVECESFPGLSHGLRGLPVPPQIQTVAEGIAVATAGLLPLALARRYVDDVVLVPEEALERAIHTGLEEARIVMEGAGAAPLAALLRNRERFAGRRVGMIISGGNIDSGLLASIITRVRLQEKRVTKIRVHIDDGPGHLAHVSALFERHCANIIDIDFHRHVASVPAKCARLDFTIETHSPGDVAALVDSLCANGFPTEVVDATT
jgi:threonine dehydratase